MSLNDSKQPNKFTKVQLSFIEQKSLLRLGEWLEQIYLDQVSVKDLLMCQYTQFKLAYGDAYTLIKDKILQFSSIHRFLLSNSFQVLFANKDFRQENIEAAIWIICDHYDTMISTNHQACLLWQTYFRNWKINEETLNDHCLRNLIPSNQQLPFERLLKCMQHMFNYRQSQRIKNLHKKLKDIFDHKIKLDKVQDKQNIKGQNYQIQAQQIIKSNNNQNQYPQLTQVITNENNKKKNKKKKKEIKQIQNKQSNQIIKLQVYQRQKQNKKNSNSQLKLIKIVKNNKNKDIFSQIYKKKNNNGHNNKDNQSI